MIILIFFATFLLIALLTIFYSLLAAKKKEAFLWAAGTINFIIYAAVAFMLIMRYTDFVNINPFPFFIFAVAEIILFAITCFICCATLSKEKSKHIITGVIALFLAAVLIGLAYIDTSVLTDALNNPTQKTEVSDETTDTPQNDYTEKHTTEPQTEPVTEPYSESETEPVTETEATTTTTKPTTTRPTTRPTTEPTTQYSAPEQLHSGSSTVYLDLSTDNEFVFYPSSSGYYVFFSDCNSHDLSASAETSYSVVSNDDYDGNDFLICIYCYEDEPVNLSVHKYGYDSGYAFAELSVYEANIPNSSARSRYADYLINGIEITASDDIYYSPSWSSSTATFNNAATRYPVDYYYDSSNNELWVAFNATNSSGDILVWYPC